MKFCRTTRRNNNLSLVHPVRDIFHCSIAILNGFVKYFNRGRKKCNIRLSTNQISCGIASGQLLGINGCRQMHKNSDSLGSILFFSLVILTSLKPCKTASNVNDVIEVPVKPQIVKHEVSDEPRITKLKCNILKNSFKKYRIMSVNEMRWERKNCGYGLHLINCANYQTIPWTSIMCKNGTKFCDGYTLKLDNPTASDSGYYRCLYKNYMSRQFKVYKVFYLDVYDPVGNFELLDEPVRYDVRRVYVNDTVTFRCRARSLSPLYMIWARVATPDYDTNRTVQYGTQRYELLKNNGTYRIGDDLYISKLTISKCQIPDNGQYYCTVISVNNAHLPKNKTVSLFVMPRNQAQTVQNALILQLLMWIYFQIKIH